MREAGLVSVSGRVIGIGEPSVFRGLIRLTDLVEDVSDLPVDLGGPMVCLGSMSERRIGTIAGFAGTARGLLTRGLGRRLSPAKLGQPLGEFVCASRCREGPLPRLLAALARHEASVPESWLRASSRTGDGVPAATSGETALRTGPALTGCQ